MRAVFRVVAFLCTESLRSGTGRRCFDFKDDDLKEQTRIECRFTFRRSPPQHSDAFLYCGYNSIIVCRFPCWAWSRLRSPADDWDEQFPLQTILALLGLFLSSTLFGETKLMMLVSIEITLYTFWTGRIKPRAHCSVK